MKKIAVLIPTCNRSGALAVLITSLCFQTEKDFDVIISDQSDQDVLEQNESLLTAIRVLESRGHEVKVLRNMPHKGMAQQRQFLLDQVESPYSLFLDDDLILEDYVIRNMVQTLETEGCGFVANAVIGLSYRDDVRPHQQAIAFWEGKVQPEEVVPQSEAWNRYKLHNAANLLHVQQKYGITADDPRTYKIAWGGGCVLYDTLKLRDIGGFDFWQALPTKHCGEDVLAQLRVMKRYGGCGLLPSGAYHQELKTTVPDRKINAPEYLQI
ncbi:glycosyl transferase family 2 [Pontibacter ummariensis]|uniref:Glycosyl transferase family 2 n=1 Tax=Pontibacter ummariensis TaxID=1610492 RepID=A0A239FGW5_9BACT|nr:glycosyltransferase [Pontibacter ummariensis]PRY12286.1 glycosyl transferase family 2 [Pontibacter ummariensis]SNS55422.1 Glycosyl transferase family 2 [Pontibacter ummariensis]